MSFISIIIPVKNGEATLEKCLQSIRQQTIGDVEIIILDSLSVDGSRAIAKKYEAKIIEVAAGTFDHGFTRNTGISHAGGTLCYFTVQDAFLSENDQLEKMSLHFQRDANLQAVVGMQAVPPHVDKNPAKWFQRYSTPHISFIHYPAKKFSELSYHEQLAAAGTWDNVNAMYRTAALGQIPFRKTNFAEDKFWAIDALAAGLRLAFDPSLVVYHYHHHTFRYGFNVQYILNYNYYLNWKIKPAPSSFIRPLATSWYGIYKKKELSVRQKLYWYLHNLEAVSAAFLSNLIFIIVSFFGEKTLERSFKFFCRQIPQGKIK